MCLPPPPSPSPPAPPTGPPSPPAPPMAPPRPPNARCFDDTTFIEVGWPCTDWAGRQCRKIAPDFGIDVDLLVFSCPNACADATPYCRPSESELTAGPQQDSASARVGEACAHTSAAVAREQAAHAAARERTAEFTHRTQGPRAAHATGHVLWHRPRGLGARHRLCTRQGCALPRPPNNERLEARWDLQSRADVESCSMSGRAWKAVSVLNCVPFWPRLVSMTG